MNRTVDWKAEISVVAGPFNPGDTLECWLFRAAKKSTATFWHVKALFKGELTDPKYSVAYKILSAADKARIEGARRNAEKLANTYRGAAHALNNIDPDFHRSNVVALLNAARILSDLDRAGTDEEVM